MSSLPNPGSTRSARVWAGSPEATTMRQTVGPQSNSTLTRMAKPKLAPSVAVKTTVWVRNPGPMAEVAMRNAAQQNSEATAALAVGRDCRHVYRFYPETRVAKATASRCLAPIAIMPSALRNRMSDALQRISAALAGRYLVERGSATGHGHGLPGPGRQAPPGRRHQGAERRDLRRHRSRAVSPGNRDRRLAHPSQHPAAARFGRPAAGTAGRST